MAILHALLTDAPLPERCCDHALGGQWKDFRDCHVKPDLILLYRKARRHHAATGTTRVAQRSWGSSDSDAPKTKNNALHLST